MMEKSERTFLFSVAMNIILFFLKYFLGVFSGSLALIADSIHSISDVIGSVAVFIGLKISKRRSKAFPYGLYKVENLIALVSSFLIFFAGYEIITWAVKGKEAPLLKNLSPTLAGILSILVIVYGFMRYERTIILKEPRVDELKSLTGRNSGRYKFIEADVTLRVTELERAHQISQRLEEKIKKDIPYVDHILIHYEPIKREFSHIAIPFIARDNKISEHFGEAPTFLILTVKLKDNSLVRQNSLTNPYLLEEKGKGIMVAEFLVKNSVDRVVVREKFHGKGPEYVFREAGVEVTITPKSDLREVIAELKIRAGLSESIVEK